jgi:hypothetical protein
MMYCMTGSALCFGVWLGDELGLIRATVGAGSMRAEDVAAHESACREHGRPQRRKRNEMRRQAWTGFRSAKAVIALALVAAACGSGGSSAPGSVVVPGTEQWTDTGIDLSIDDTVSIEADGEITPSAPNVLPNGPNGHPNPAARQFNVRGLEEANHAGLIGRIGVAGAPFQVGSQLLSKVHTEGRLYLGINDGDVGNNAGEFTATITVNRPGGIDPATLAIDGLLEDFNAQDAEAVAGVFGDDVAFTLESGEEVVGADAATFWQGYFGQETGERITDAFHASDGRTYFLAEFTLRGGHSWLFVFDVEMDGERLVRMGARPRTGDEVLATRKIDNLYQAFNDADLDRLREEFKGITYRSPSGVDFTGAEAAEHWADAFGVAVTRTTGVFAIGDDAAVFVTEHRQPAGLSAAYVVDVEISGGGLPKVTRLTERRLEI